MNGAARRATNEEAVERFFASWDPAWRWVLILGMRQMRADPVALGGLASAEANGSPSWSGEQYAYGPLSRGITAAAVNEAAQHCEDLFALLRVLREPQFFAREMANYNAGRVVEFGRRLATAEDLVISRLFLIPNPADVRRGLAGASDPKLVAQVEAGRRRLAGLVRETAEFYRTFEDFHVQYKHGLKLPLQSYGELPEETIAERQVNLRAPLVIYTTEPISSMLRRPPHEWSMAFIPGPVQQAHLRELVEDRNILRFRTVAEVDLDEVVDRSHTVLTLLQLAQANRLALGRVKDGLQCFSLPGENRWETVNVSIQLDEALSLRDFADAPDGLRPARKRRR